MKKIAVLVGSLRKDSFNKKIANELIRLASDSLEMEIAEIGDLNLFNEDLLENSPSSWKAFKKKIKEADGILFVSPEYNRSIPGVLKNAIDIATRPPSENVLFKKPAAVVTASPSKISAIAGNHAIRQAVIFSQVRMLPTEVYIGEVDKLFKEDQKTLVESTEKFLSGVLKEFEDWVKLFS